LFKTGWGYRGKSRDTKVKGRNNPEGGRDFRRVGGPKGSRWWEWGATPRVLKGKGTKRKAGTIL